MARYDMWGTDHEGVATFKASFGGAERQYIGAWELVTNRAAFVASGAVRGPGRLSSELRGPVVRRGRLARAVRRRRSLGMRASRTAEPRPTAGTSASWTRPVGT